MVAFVATISLFYGRIVCDHKFLLWPHVLRPEVVLLVVARLQPEPPVMVARCATMNPCCGRNVCDHLPLLWSYSAGGGGTKFICEGPTPLEFLEVWEFQEFYSIPVKELNESFFAFVHFPENEEIEIFERIEAIIMSTPSSPSLLHN